jgi:hypothetical protein
VVGGQWSVAGGQSRTNGTRGETAARRVVKRYANGKVEG